MTHPSEREAARDPIGATQACHLVPGAAGGIGSELARRLAAGGSRLALAEELEAVALTVEATDLQFRGRDRCPGGSPGGMRWRPGEEVPYLFRTA